MGNLDRVTPSQQFLNLFGSVDEAAEREKTYHEAKNRYPIDAKFSTCASLDVIVKNMALDIDGMYQTKTNSDAKSTQRIQNRYIDGYTRYLNEVKSMYNSKQCEKIQQEEEEKRFFDTQYSNLERVKGLSEETGSTTKYLIFGMLGLVILVSGIIIFKKK